MHSLTLKGEQVFLPLALELLALGLCPVLLKPGGKEPVFISYNRWAIGQYTAHDLQLPEDKRPLYYNQQVIETWAREYPDANIGLLTRERPTVDVDNEAVWELVAPILMANPTRHIKRGRRGWSLIFRPSATDPVKRGRAFSQAGVMHVEVLTEGRQTVLPPSMHPDTRQPYFWVEGSVPLDATPPPELTQKMVDSIELALRSAGLYSGRIRGSSEVVVDDSHYAGNEDRYRKFYQLRLTDKYRLVTEAPEGARQQFLNDAVLSCSPAVRVGALTEPELWKAMYQACLHNGYIQTDGYGAFQRQFAKALEEGMEISVLSDIGERQIPSASAQEVFRGHAAPMVGSMPTLPVSSGLAAAPPLLQLMDAGQLAQHQAPPREWTVDGWIPHKQISLVYGDGGTGKTTLLLQLAIASSQGVNFLGLPTARRKVLFVSAEDEAAELHYRIREMGQAFQIVPGSLDVLSLADLPSAELAGPYEGKIQLTGLFCAIEDLIRTGGHGMVILDPIADMFGGVDVDKRQVNQFLRQVRKRLCFDLGVTVVIAAHPSSDGMRSGKGTAGTTAWSNGARSRCYFEPGEGDVMLLRLMKANRSKKGDSLAVRWVKGVFVKTSREAAKQSPSKVAKVLEAIRTKGIFYRKDTRADEWVGRLVARELGMDLATERRKVMDIIDAWEADGLIRYVEEKTDKRMTKWYVEFVKHPPVASVSESLPQSFEGGGLRQGG